MVQKHLAEYEKDKKDFQSTVSSECWRCRSRNTQKVDSGVDVIKCKDCGSTTKYYTYASWIRNIKSTSKYNIKSAEEAIRVLKAEKLRKEKEYKKNVDAQKERIKWAREKIRSVK
jgi:hypothetical protein